MKLKLDENGNAVLVDGKPVYIAEDGKELPMDVPSMYSKITALTNEAKDHRLKRTEAEEKLKAFEGIEDAEAAKKALSTVQALDEKKLVDAGKIEELRAAAVKAHEEKIRAMETAHATELKKVTEDLSQLRSQYNSEKVSTKFASSKFIGEKFAVPADLVQAKFGQHFRVEDDQGLVAYDASGNKIYSRNRPGELADFDEAMEVIVDQYPHKESILKGTGHSGGGAKGGGDLGAGGGSGGGKKQGNFGGSREERAAAIRSKFPDLPAS